MKYFALSLFIISSCLSFPAQTTVHPGISHFESGRYAEAISELSTAVKTPAHVNDSEMWNVLGMAYVGTNEFSKAKTSFERAIKIDPRKAAFHVNISSVYLIERNEKKAIAATDKALALDSNNLMARNIRGISYARQKRWDEALAESERLIQIDPNFLGSYLINTEVYFEKTQEQLLRVPESAKAADILAGAYERLNIYLANCKLTAVCDAIRDEIETVDGFIKLLTTRVPTFSEITAVEPGVTPLKVLTYSKQQFYNSARSAGGNVTTVLAAQFKKTGNIGRVLGLRSNAPATFPAAIADIQQFRFEPKRVNGVAVSTVQRIEFIHTLR